MSFQCGRAYDISGTLIALIQLIKKTKKMKVIVQK